MRRLSAVVASLSVAVTGCSFSTVDPNASVVVSGTALDAAGEPLADTKVLLFKQADIGGVLFGGVLALGSLGTVCLLPDAPAICNKARTARTDSRGRYHFDLKGEDTQGTLGTEATLNVVFSAPNRAASTTVSFTAKETAIRLPEARLVNLAARVSRSGGRIRVSWSPLPGAAGHEPTYSAQLYGASGSALWSQSAGGRRATVDPRLLEDRSGTVAVNARTTLSGGSGTGEVHGYYLSRKLPVKATAGAPPSRGRRCAAVTGTAPAKDGGFSRCAATDGDLDTAARLTGSGVVTGAVVDLGRVRGVDLVVARGFTGQLVVEVSRDGSSFSTVATSAGFATAITLPGGTRARYVRLRSPSGLDQSLSTELSVW